MRQHLGRGIVTRQTSAWLIVFGVWLAGAAQAQETTGRFVDKVFRDEAGEHKYVVFVPAAYRADKPSPAILFLHGAGERGIENRMPLTIGLAPYVQARAKTFPFLVVFPQCESTDGRILESWQTSSADGRRALAILDDAKKQFRIDDKRVVLSGWSMGGYGAWSLAAAEPSRWSCVVPVSGGGDVEKMAALKDVPVWAFHGEKDTLIKAEESRKLVEALKGAGGTVTYTELPKGGHDISEAVYGNEAVVQWMLAPRKAPTELGPQTVKAVAAVNVPFVPAVEMPQAVGIRLGNDALAALSYSAPQTIPANLLTGSLGDMFDSTSVQGRSFSIRFSGISYRGSVERVLVRGWGRDKLLVQIGVRNVTLTIGGTYVNGQRHAAQAGPITIMIGHRYPVWLNLEVTPYIADRKIRLKSGAASFQIPNDNWYVTQPAGVSTQGFGMTQGAVTSGLTNGLYGSKGRIENEVLAIAPNIVKQLEDFLVLPDTGMTLSSLWPLPVNPPRLKAYPEQIVTDEHGVSLIVGLTAGSLNPFGPASALKKVAPAGVTLAQLAGDKALHVTAAPQILEPLTQMVIDADQAKLDLLDIPEPLFAKLAERATLQELIPDLKQYGEALQVRSTLRVTSPLTVGEPSEPAVSDGPKPFEFNVSGLQIDVQIKTDPAQTKWQPCATFDLKISEQVQASLVKPSHERRQLRLDWLPVSSVTGSGRFAEGYQAKDTSLNTESYIA
ncbi:MAG: prolyl oligopeptidase family serine peptidase, partial [Candidatus Saccharimonas sp.]|nr:prolyl oligopeptidase family serine peptidase [Planctomycetaceae bacterium]